MSKHIVFVCRSQIESIPPVMNSIVITAELGYRVSVISSFIEKETKEFLSEKYGIEFHLMGRIIRGKNYYTTVRNNLRFRAFVKNIIKNLKPVADIFWMAGEATALSLFRSAFLKEIRYIYNSFELFEQGPFKFANKSMMQNAQVNIVPEYNRALIFRRYFNLEKTPFVLPNKSTYIVDVMNEMKGIKSSVCLKNIVDEMNKKANGRKILLYQGGISKIRNLDAVVKFSKIIANEYLLVLMGDKNSYLEELLRISDNFFHIDYIPAPYHLMITKNASIGIVSYDYSTLNNIYCAPNKIFEYSKYGIPMLCNDVGGLISTIGQAQAGVCVDFSSIDKIIEGLNNIRENYSLFSKNSYNYYQSIDMHNLHLEILKGL